MSLSSNSFLVFCAVVATVWTSAASAANTQAGSAIHQRYLEDRAACMKIAGADTRKTCLREAGAAQVEAKRGTLAEPQANFEKNRFARCSVYKDPKEREYCVRRMRGEGTTSGSVEEGAIVRSLTVPVPASD
jgi:hypothetical protein